MSSHKKFKVPSLEEMENADQEMQKVVPKQHFKSSTSLSQQKNTLPGTSSSSSSNASHLSQPAVKSSDPFSAIKQSSFFNQVTEEFKAMVEKEASAKVEPVTVNQTVQTSTSSVNAPIISNKIIVHHKQRGNPLLKGIVNVPWEFGDNIIPDYVLGKTTCALFLSIRYHSLNPNYIQERIKQLGRNYELRILLVQVDMQDPHHALNQLMKLSITTNMTMILAWSPEEAGRHLTTYKMFQFKPADMLMKKQEADNCSKVIDALTSVKSINRSDAVVLLDQFKTIERIIKASVEELSFCPGIGMLKATKLHSVLHQNFLKTTTT